MNGYGIELSFNNRQEVLHLPVNPESIEVTDSGNGQTYDILSLGEINVIKSQSLTEYSFSSLFPAQRYPFVVSQELLPPPQYVETILRWMGTKRPIRFIFTSRDYDINTPVSIEEFEWREVAGSPGDIEYTLSLKKYVFYEARKVQVVTPQSTGQPTAVKEAPKRPDDRILPRTYTLVPGDNLWKIAQKFLGDGTRWREIQRLNNIPESQLRRLPVGMTIKLPEA